MRKQRTSNKIKGCPKIPKQEKPPLEDKKEKNQQPMNKFKELIGKRILITEAYSESLKEFKVIEVSPSGERVKLQYQSGLQIWGRAQGFMVIEVLE